MKKKLLGWLAMATMLVGTGCSSDEVVNDYSPENAIEFGTYVGRGASGRAADITTANLGTQGFGVFAYYTTDAEFNATIHTPNFMYNQEVKNTSAWNATNGQYSGPWVYAPVKYWPNNVNDKVSFFAYAPYCTTVNSNVTVAAATNTPGYPSVNFTLYSNDVTKQSDLLWAAPVLNLSKKSTEPIDTDDKVKFQFKHALSRIGFEVQTMIDQKNQDGDGNTDGTSGNGETLDNAYTKVVVKNVNLKGKFFNKGTLTWNNNTAAIGGSDIKDTEFKLSADNFAHSENIVWGSKENKYTVLGQSVNNVEAVLNNTNSYIMVIPQDFTNESLTIEVVYDVVTADNSLNLGYSAVTNTITTTFKGVKFEANKAYTFSLHLGLTTVKLTASVDAWGTGTDYSVNVPINTTGTDNTNDGVEDGSSN